MEVGDFVSQRKEGKGELSNSKLKDQWTSGRAPLAQAPIAIGSNP